MVEVVIHVTPPEKEDLVRRTVLAFMFSKRPLNKDSRCLQTRRSGKDSLWKEDQAEQVGVPQRFSHVASLTYGPNLQ